MREHMGLFRGKRIDNGEWIEGSLLFDPDLGGTQIIGFEYREGEPGIERGEFCESVDPDTVGECTGLRDKNGKLIFEGDRLGHPLNSVELVNGEWCVNGDKSLYIMSKWCEVIGNIHDPELLKGGEGE